jgi:hypothetical protein
VLIDSLRVVLLALSLAMGFAAAGQRRGSALSQRAEWGMALAHGLDRGLSWRDRHFQSPPGERPAPGRGQAADGAYFETHAADQEKPPRG